MRLTKYVANLSHSMQTLTFSALQGMDQRAERVVHNSMVNVTCQADSAQYFLITPKLLPDLNYHERMKILCVNNGEWLPEEKDIGRMSDMIDVFESRNRRSGPHTM
jgi:hypothetical protein